MKLKKLALATSILTTSSLAVGANNMDIIKKDNNPLGNKPYAEVAISANGNCDYQILINDVPIYADTGAIDTTLPVNQYMINGKNNLSLTIQDKDINCDLSATLQVRNADDFNSSKDISTINFDGNPTKADNKNISKSIPAEKLAYINGKFKKSDDGYIEVAKAELKTGNVFYGYNYDNQKRENMAGVKVSQDINLPIDLPKWAWEDGETITNDQATKDQLIAIYKTIWKLIEDKDWDKLNKMFELRDNEMAEALYSDPNTVEAIREKADDSDNKLNIPPSDKLLRESVEFNLIGNSKFITLIFWNNRNLLGFKTPSGSSNFGIKFAKINGKFVIVR